MYQIMESDVSRGQRRDDEWWLYPRSFYGHFALLFILTALATPWSANSAEKEWFSARGHQQLRSVMELKKDGDKLFGEVRLSYSARTLIHVVFKKFAKKKGRGLSVLLFTVFAGKICESSCDLHPRLEARPRQPCRPQQSRDGLGESWDDLPRFEGLSEYHEEAHEPHQIVSSKKKFPRTTSASCLYFFL